MPKLMKSIMGEVAVINLLDDSMLQDMIHGHMVEEVEKRWIKYSEIAASMGADAVLSACSSVGEFAEKAGEYLKIPVYRIDEAMAERAVEAGKTISVFATLSTTLEPTVNLIKRKASAAGKECIIHTVLVSGAYEELMKGNRELHNQKIQEAVLRYSDSDALVLAQASMASALEGLQGIDTGKVLTSPVLGMEKLKKDLEL